MQRPTRWTKKDILGFMIGVLAFVAGAGVALSSLSGKELGLPEWGGVLAAGATAVLMRFFPKGAN